MQNKKVAIGIGCAIGYVSLGWIFGFRTITIIIFLGAIAYGVYKYG